MAIFAELPAINWFNVSVGVYAGLLTIAALLAGGAL